MEVFGSLFFINYGSTVIFLRLFTLFAGNYFGLYPIVILENHSIISPASFSSFIVFLKDRFSQEPKIKLTKHTPPPNPWVYSYKNSMRVCVSFWHLGKSPISRYFLLTFGMFDGKVIHSHDQDEIFIIECNSCSRYEPGKISWHDTVPHIHMSP